MARRLLLEGDDIDELLRRVRADHGQEARIVGAEEKLVGGVGGFFARRRYEVAVALDDDGAGAVDLPDHHAGQHSGLPTGQPDRSDVTSRNGVQLDLGTPPGAPVAGSAEGHVGTRRALPVDGPASRRQRPITSLEDLMEAAGQQDGATAVQHEAPQEPFQPTAYRRGAGPRHAAVPDTTRDTAPDGPPPTSTATSATTATTATAASTVFDDLMRDLAARAEPVHPTDLVDLSDTAPTRRSRHAAAYDAHAAEPAARALPQAVAAVLDAVAGPERRPAPVAWQAPPAPPAAPAPDRAVAADRPATTPPSHPTQPPVQPVPPSPLVALGMPAPQADPRIALLDVLSGVAVAAPRSLRGVHVVVGDEVATHQLAATWLRHCAADESAVLRVAPAGAGEGDGLDAVRAGLASALDLDGGALVVVDAGPSRARARRAARQVEALGALLDATGMSAAGVTVTVTAVLDARWDVETTRDWLDALTCQGTVLTDLGAHGVSESAVPLRLLSHGLRVSWLDAAPATLGAWAGPCLDRMVAAG